MLRRGLAPAALLLAVVVATWFVSGVGALDIVRFVAYELVFVAVPGGVVLWALRGTRPGFLIAIAIGWPLGQTAEILAFTGTAAVGARGLFIAYPLVVIGLSLIVIRLRQPARRNGEASDPLSAAMVWTAAVALALGLIFLAYMFLPKAPLPSTTVPVAYDPDFPFFIGLIAQVLHHWPPTSPGLSGVPLHYEWFVFFHMAAIAQVTHISIATIALRLDYVPTIVVVGLQLLAVGRFVGRSAWAGVLAIAVTFLLGPLDLTTDANGGSPFFEGFFAHLWASWTFPFGLMFFLALLYLIIERLQVATWRTPDDISSWVLMGLLMIGASGAKATVLPVILTGTVIYTVAMLVTRRTVPRAALMVLGIGVVVFAITFFAVYGGGAPGTVIQPFVPMSLTLPAILAEGVTGHILRAILLPFAEVAGLAGGMLGVAGMVYLLRRRHRTELSRLALPISFFVAGIVIANIAHQGSGSELYFEDTGYVAGCIAAAMGIRLAWQDAGHALPVSRRSIMWTCAASAVVLVALVVITSRTFAHPQAVNVRYIVLAVGSALLVATAALVLRARGQATSGVWALGLVPFVVATMLTYPMALSPVARDVLTGVTLTPPADPAKERGLTPGLLAALLWLKDHSSVDAVFAVNNHWIDPAGTNGKFYYYSAFSERQVFVEAYDPIRFGITTGLATPAGVNFALRQRLNNAVFDDANVGALRTLTQQYSVRFLFIDRVNGSADPAVVGLGSVVFSNADATIVAVR